MFLDAIFILKLLHAPTFIYHFHQEHPETFQLFLAEYHRTGHRDFQLPVHPDLCER